MRNLLIIVALASLLVVPATAQEHWELVGSPFSRNEPWPMDGSEWHGLAPVGIHCTIAVQESHEDNGNGVVDECDHITLSGTRYHITWAGPTYHLVALGGSPPWPDGGAEPADPLPGENPTCEMWHWIYPEDAYCSSSHVDDWEDSGVEPGILDACDNVLLDGIWWHVVEVSWNIEVVEDPDPVEGTTWTKIKDFFKDLF